MRFNHWLIAAFWLVFVAYWTVSAVGVKRTIGDARTWRRRIGPRLGILILVLLAARLRLLSHVARNTGLLEGATSMPLGLAGVALCALGVGLAILARVHLGRNWGLPMSRKENPELVTTGPYEWIRHPIYTGILLAMLGSTLGQSLLWLPPLVLCAIYFIYSARREEKLMIEQFPATYPAYMRRTKMLLPFVL